MSAFFSILDYIFDTLRPDFDSNGPRMAFMESIDSFFDLVRSDTMAYINLSGNPYCNSSRYCEYLCKEAPASRNSQSNSRSYRICSHLFLAGLVSTINILLQGKETSLFIALVVFILSLFLSTFFISLHADAAEAIQIIFLLDY